MSRSCSICEHPKRPEIEEAIASRVPYRRIGAKYQVSPAALSRHLNAHVRDEVLALLRKRVSTIGEIPTFSPAEDLDFALDELEEFDFSLEELGEPPPEEERSNR